ncbi:hypothetical protein ACJX0J_035397, partial [Zea mays]
MQNYSTYATILQYINLLCRILISATTFSSLSKTYITKIGAYCNCNPSNHFHPHAPKHARRVEVFTKVKMHRLMLYYKNRKPT